MKKKLFSRLLCASLAVLMAVCILPALSVGAEENSKVPAVLDSTFDYTSVVYDSEEERLASMTKYYDNGEFILYGDNILGVVAFQNVATGETLFTNPWDTSVETNKDPIVRSEMMSQIIMEYKDSENNKKTFYSYTDAALKGQITLKSIKNGMRVEYAIGERSSRILCPRQIEKTAFETKILKPMIDRLGENNRTLARFKAYFTLQAYTTSNSSKQESIANSFPVCAQKNIDIYVCAPNATTNEMRQLESWIMSYAPEYTFEIMDNDYDMVNYEETAISPPVFKMAIEYVVQNGELQVTLPANGLRYDETTYRITDFQVLPFMGASSKLNEGYSFLPDGSGALYDLAQPANIAARVYGEDYALYSNVMGYHNETVRVPVFGQVESKFIPKLITPEKLDSAGNVITPAVYSETEGETVKRGYVAIIEEGATMASIAPNHTQYMVYTSVIPSFITRQSDVSASKWTVYANRRYTGDYRIRYILLNDDAKAEKAKLTSYYECSWMGMALAYRDYMARTNETYQRLTDADVNAAIPLYIETFGCMNTTKKVLSMPVTVSVALTSFEDITKMYDYLAGEGVTNVNFKMTGYANGGLYADVPYKLKWNKSVGGRSDFKSLAKYAAEKGFGIFPDFDFVFTSHGEGGRAVKMKKNAARTIDNRYTSKRVYSATQQTLVSYYQMVLSPATYSKFYQKLEKKYSKYGVSGISLSTLGDYLNSDYDSNKTVLREEAKDYVVEALAYFKNKNYDVMIGGGNAYTWSYADHILEVPLDSSRYNASFRSVPFVGVILHGYVEFAGSAYNKESNMSYAMLKAMENGASIYFILSYANTELLKEDILLSQNYSVRYDIWQQRLVEVYKELNAVLYDVQTKLIINHQFLEGSRVPNENELLQDIAAEMEEQAAKLEEKIEAERLAAVRRIRTASDTVANSVTSMDGYATNIFNTMSGLKSECFAQNNVTPYLLLSWKLYRDELKKSDDDPTKDVEGRASTLSSQINAVVASSVAQMTVNLQNTAKQLANAKEAYDVLVSCNANAQIVQDARANLMECVEYLITAYSNYRGSEVAIPETLKNAYVDGNETTVEMLIDAMVISDTALKVAAEDLDEYFFGDNEEIKAKYAVISAETLERAIVDLMIADGLYNEEDPENSLIPYDELVRLQIGFLTVPPKEDDPEEPEQPGENEGEENEDVVIPDPPKSKYSMDNSLVLVTYGEPGTPYKSLILNFNDYTVQTTVNGVTYTIEGYGYVVIYH